MSTNFAYYCSGHGYGHATRVSALASQILQLSPKPTVTIVSEAPPHVFSDSIKLGAKYRNAKIDPVVQQPLAYRIDRKKSVDVLNAFLAKRESLINDEVAWLKANKIHCVLSDAVFIACAAAHRAFLPSALVTNFTFDSIWSYLSAPLLEPQTPATSPPPPPTLSNLAPNPSPPAIELELEPDEPIPHDVMDPLADQIARDYRNADLLLRLPGYLPFPSFSPTHPLPATDWIDPAIQRFRPSVLASLHQPAEQLQLYDPIPFPDGGPKKPLPRQLKAAPLLVRHPASDIYSAEARRRLLDSIGIPREFQDPQKTKIVIVSFGGQVIKRPTHSRNGSRNLSMSGTPMVKPTELAPIPKQDDLSLGSKSPKGSPPRSSPPLVLLDDVDKTPRLGDDVKEVRPHTPPEIRLEKLKVSLQNLPRIATPSHIYVPGAPPASNPASPILQRRPTFPSLHEMVGAASVEEEPEPCLLPDGWIAIVCGVAKNWGEEDLPEGFFVAPRDVWMPDLTAVADVLLGKLGYGTCAECVDACTPFVYVPRPFFVEEHGLRELMESSGVGVLLPQERYELGDWAGKIEEAYEKGKFMKAMKRQQGWSDIRKREADVMARELVGWVNKWYELLDSESTSSSYSLNSSTGIVGDVTESDESRTLQPQVGLGLGLGGVPITA